MPVSDAWKDWTKGHDDMSRFCKDCRFIVPSSHPMCSHPSSVAGIPQVDMVTGKNRPAPPLSCADARIFTFSERFCGYEGKHWEPIDTVAPVGFT